HFLFDIAGLEPTWTMANVVEEQVERIRAQIGDGRALCALSGGVDSAVAAALVQRAIGDRLTCVYVDHGLMREGETEQIEPDVVESGGGTGTANIKSHHNVGGLPEDLMFTLVEPLRTLFKDEVREVGVQLGLPEAMVWRQPFPGPGLGIRIVGEVTQQRLDTL